MTAARPIIACLGAGRMGRGIAVVFAYAGHAVTLIDVKARSAEQFATARSRGARRNRQDACKPDAVRHAGRGDADAILARVAVVPAQDTAAALAGAGIVFEGVPEVVELKREVLAAASKCVGPDIDHRLDHVDDPGRRYLRRGRTSRTLSQRALAQPRLSDAAGRNVAGRATDPDAVTAR